MQNASFNANDLKFDPPTFAVNFLSDQLEKYYGLTGVLKPLAGERDQNHQITTPDGHKYVLKVASRHEDRAVIDYQISVLNHVERKAPTLNIPRNIMTVEGNNFALIRDDEGQVFVMRLLSYVDGVPFGYQKHPPENIIYEAGKFQGDLCDALTDFSHASQGHFMPWDISRGVVLSPILKSSRFGDVERLVLPHLDHFEHTVLPKLNSFRKQTIHNDAHDGNMLISESGFKGLIDFGDIVHAPVIQDAAIPLTRFVGLTDDPLKYGGLYLEGFCRSFPLYSEEIELLYDLLMLRAALTLQLMDFRIKNNDRNKTDLKMGYPRLVKMFENLIALDQSELTRVFHEANEKGNVNDQ
ncbi:MAG: phosphotransferase [Kordiimonadaceae bacterium]|nr:phosphotransferase [Kordiimonadaceae bacterium]